MAAGKLKIDIRREKILEILSIEKQVSVAQLSEELKASPTTIRSDLDSLALSQKLTRVKGGAIAAVPAHFTQSADPASGTISHLEGKRKIAAAAARFIKDQDTIFINSGSTCVCVAEALQNHKGLRVVTNSLDVARKLSNTPTFHVVLLGGKLNMDYEFTYGGDAISQIRHYQSAWSILSVDGINADIGIATYHPEEAIINKTMIEQARNTMIVADYRKIGRAGFTRTCAAGKNQLLITDCPDDQEALARLRETGMEIVCV